MNGRGSMRKLIKRLICCAFLLIFGICEMSYAEDDLVLDRRDGALCFRVKGDFIQVNRDPGAALESETNQEEAEKFLLILFSDALMQDENIQGENENSQIKIWVDIQEIPDQKFEPMEYLNQYYSRQYKFLLLNK